MNRSTGIYDKFASALSNAVQKMQVGDGFHEGVLQVISCAPYVTLVFPGRIDGTIFIFETLVLDLFVSSYDGINVEWSPKPVL